MITRSLETSAGNSEMPVAHDQEISHEEGLPRPLIPMARRSFLILISGVSVAIWASRTALGAPLSVAAYHDATAAQHQKQFEASDGLGKKGFRIRSLSVYRRDDAPLYAAVWTTESGSQWRAFHGLSSSGYQEFYDEWYPQGYRPTIVTATGGGVIGLDQKNASVFAGVFEKSAESHPAKHDINLAAFKAQCEWAKKSKHILHWAAIYGGKERRYAGIWMPVAAGVTWDYKISIAIDGPEQGVPPTMPNKPSLRLAFVTRSPFGEYLAVYRSDQKESWVERHAMTSAQYQTQHDALKAQGYYPWVVQAGGDPRVSNMPRFVALFRKL